MMKKVASTLTRRHFSTDGGSGIGGGGGGGGGSGGGSGGGIGGGGSGTVKYTPCSRLDLHACTDDDNLDEIAVVSNADPGAVKYGSGSFITANGPRVVPGIITSERCGRLVSSGGDHRLTASGTRINMPSPAAAYLGKSNENMKGKSVSRQSLLEMVSTRLTVGGGNVGGGGGGGGGGRGGGIGGGGGGYRNSTRFSRDSVAYVNRAHVSSDLDVSWNKVPSSARVFGAGVGGGASAAISGVGGAAGVGGMVAATTTSTSATTPTATTAMMMTTTLGPAATSRRAADARDMRNKMDQKWEAATATMTTIAAGAERSGCKWTFVFDPSGRLCYYWSMVVSVAFLYNFWALIYRCAFQEISKTTLTVWFCLDYMADFTYVLDVAFHFRTGYLEDGVLQTDSLKLRQHYVNSTMFYVDCLCLLPLDFLYLSIGFNSILRSFRLVKIYRFWAFLDRTERHTNYPNVFRALSLIHYLLVIFHWNACLCHLISKNGGFGSKSWVYPDGIAEDVIYITAFYWSTLTLTTIGDMPRPRTRGEFFFVIVELIFALLLFATVLGHVANIVTNVSAARKEFQAKLDGVKTYMRMRRVSQHLQVKVIKWFDYLWMTQKSSDEEKAVSCLPDKLKAEIAIHVHLDTLKRVEIFQNTEAGFLCELVLRLRPVLFSPGDYICRKGEVGKEMYIVNRGRLQVVADNGKTVLATLRAGSYFGEISILNMGTAGNRRTASVRSVGYSDLFCLSKKDMWDVLKEYPAARVRLEAIASKRLEKYKRAPLEKIAMGRSQSSPGLVESLGRVPLEEMYVPIRIQPSPSEYSSDRRNMESPLTAASTTSNASDDVASFSGLVVTSGAAQPINTIHSHFASSTITSSQHQPQQQLQGRSMMMMGFDPILDRQVLQQQQQQQQLPLPAHVGLQSSMSRSASPFAQHPHHRVHPHLDHHHHHHQQQQQQQQQQSFYYHPSAVQSTTQTSGAPVQVPTVSGIVAPPPYHLTTVHVVGSSPLPPPPPPLHSTMSIGSSSLQLFGGVESSPQELLAEIKRLRERLVGLETENASMSMKLSQQQWEVEHRLAEIEMHICSGGGGGGGGGSVASMGSTDDNERNKESII